MRLSANDLCHLCKGLSMHIWMPTNKNANYGFEISRSRNASNNANRWKRSETFVKSRVANHQAADHFNYFFAPTLKQQKRPHYHSRAKACLVIRLMLRWVSRDPKVEHQRGKDHVNRLWHRILEVLPIFGCTICIVCCQVSPNVRVRIIELNMSSIRGVYIS